jgi:dTMP kinase
VSDPGVPPADRENQSNGDADTEPLDVRGKGEESPEDTGRFKLLGSSSFFRLWIAQVVSSLGDWIGLVAILALAARVGGSSPEASVALVMSARMIPGFFLASVGGVLVDRWDRKKVMVICDIGRGLVMGTLPFVDSVFGLFVASLVLEVLTLMWSPAKEASVPNLVSVRQLPTANSLSLAAAYGTFPIGAALFASLTKVSEFVGDHAGALDFLSLNQESLAIYVDMLSFFVAAFLVSTVHLPKRTKARAPGRIDLGQAFTEIKEGWRFIQTSPSVRAVIVGLATGLIGGGMVAPLGPTFSAEVLDAGPAGFGLLITALGMGVAIGVVGLSTVRKPLPYERLFPLAALGAGAGLMAAASTSSLAVTMVLIGFMGVNAGAIYVLGFTILQQRVDDELRGRIFASLYTLTRLCLVISLTLAPLLAGLLNDLSERLLGGEIDIGDATITLQGVRLTLWIGGGIILLAAVWSMRTLRAIPDEPGGVHPSSAGEGPDEAPEPSA